MCKSYSWKNQRLPEISRPQGGSTNTCHILPLTPDILKDAALTRRYTRNQHRRLDQRCAKHQFCTPFQKWLLICHPGTKTAVTTTYVAEPGLLYPTALRLEQNQNSVFHFGRGHCPELPFVGCDSGFGWRRVSARCFQPRETQALTVGTDGFSEIPVDVWV